MRVAFYVVSICVGYLAMAQYWIGPKVGYHYTIHDYQDEEYESQYKIHNNHNYELGVAVTYSVTDRYAVHGELFFERMGNRVVNKENDFTVDSRSNFNYLSFPILLRVSMGHSPVHWYLNGGPKVSFWMSGKGRIATSQFEEFEGNRLDDGGFFNYKIAFDGSKADGLNNAVYLVNEANRIQYSLTVGGGFYLDLANGARLMFDARYNWGHSNMGFNLEPDETSSKILSSGSRTNVPAEGYVENYEYSHSTMSFSVAYMFEYNTQLKRKGSSTISASKKNRKATKKKKG